MFRIGEAAPPRRPRPIATVTTIVKAASGARLKVRRAYWTSPIVLSMNAVPRSSRHSSAVSVADPKRACALWRASRRGQAFVDQLLRFALDVEGELIVQLLLDAVWPEQRARPQCQVAESHGVGVPGDGSGIRFMMSTVDIIQPWCRLSTPKRL